MEQCRQLLESVRQRYAPLGQRSRFAKQRRTIACDQRIGNSVDIIGVGRAEHRAHDTLTHLAGAISDRLIEHRQRVPHRSVRDSRNQGRSPILEGNAFRAQNFDQPLRDQRPRQKLQIELKAARQHGHRNLLRVGRCQDEFHVIGRLLQRFQHRVEGCLR